MLVKLLQSLRHVFRCREIFSVQTFHSVARGHLATRLARRRQKICNTYVRVPVVSGAKKTREAGVLSCSWGFSLEKRYIMKKTVCEVICGAPHLPG